jgi:exonuclease III
MGGDWNVVQDTSIDTYNIIHNRNQNSREKIEEMLETFELLDPWRTCFPNGRKYTWRQSSPNSHKETQMLIFDQIN